jgi:hypothetical protein
MDVEYVIVPEDIIAWREYTLKHPAKGHGDPAWAVWFMTIFCVLGIIVSIAKVVGEDGNAAWGGLAVGGSFALLFTLFRRRLALLQVRGFLRRGAYADALGWQRLSISPEALIAEDKYSLTTTRWPGVKRIGVTDNHAFFFLAQGTAAILPRTPFTSHEEFTQFVETARRFRDEAVGSTPGRGSAEPKRCPDPETFIRPDRSADC